MRDATCPSCGTVFPTRAVKCICPECETAFFRGGDSFAHLGNALAQPKPPPDFAELSDYQKRYVHFVLHAIGRRGGVFTEYHCVEVGLDWVRAVLVGHGWATGKGSGLKRSYSITDAGLAALPEMDAKFGVPTAPIRPGSA